MPGRVSHHITEAYTLSDALVSNVPPHLAQGMSVAVNIVMPGFKIKSATAGCCAW